MSVNSSVNYVHEELQSFETNIKKLMDDYVRKIQEELTKEEGNDLSEE